MKEVLSVRLPMKAIKWVRKEKIFRNCTIFFHWLMQKHLTKNFKTLIRCAALTRHAKAMQAFSVTHIFSRVTGLANGNTLCPLLKQGSISGCRELAIGRTAWAVLSILPI